MIRSFDPEDPADATDLWDLKRAFELELGAVGSEGKAAAYRDKLTEAYRERYLEWIDWCTRQDPESVKFADPGDAADLPAGYVLVLPQQLAPIWDAAVVSELYVREDFRGTDVADTLLEAAMVVAREQDLPMDRLLLDVDPDNERAQGFYARHGFEEWGEVLATEL